MRMGGGPEGVGAAVVAAPEEEAVRRGDKEGA